MDSMKPLSRREGQVVELLLQGKSNKLIGLSLGITDRTVEFHLQNIYAKYQVSSRVELILALGKLQAAVKTGEPGLSTVDSSPQPAENRDMPRPLMGRPSWIDKESTMQGFLKSKHLWIGVIAALLTGAVILVLFARLTHMSAASLAPWIAPVLLLLVLLGASVGWVGRRRLSGPFHLLFSTVAGTCAGFLLMIPLVGFFLYPLTKAGESIGLTHRPAASVDLMSSLVIVVMLVIWLLAGSAIGTLLQLFSLRRSTPPALQVHASPRGL